MYKSVREIHEKIEHKEIQPSSLIKVATFRAVVFQIILINVIFSLDSIITAAGMAQRLPVMTAAIVVSMIVMMLAAKSLSDFVNRHPAIKVLVLAFLLMIGLALIADGMDFHIPKGYI